MNRSTTARWLVDGNTYEGFGTYHQLHYTNAIWHWRNDETFDDGSCGSPNDLEEGNGPSQPNDVGSVELGGELSLNISPDRFELTPETPFGWYTRTFTGDGCLPSESFPWEEATIPAQFPCHIGPRDIPLTLSESRLVAEYTSSEPCSESLSVSSSWELKFDLEVTCPDGVPPDAEWKCPPPNTVRLHVHFPQEAAANSTLSASGIAEAATPSAPTIGSEAFNGSRHFDLSTAGDIPLQVSGLNCSGEGEWSPAGPAGAYTGLDTTLGEGQTLDCTVTLGPAPVSHVKLHAGFPNDAPPDSALIVTGFGRSATRNEPDIISDPVAGHRQFVWHISDDGSDLRPNGSPPNLQAVNVTSVQCNGFGNWSVVRGSACRAAHSSRPKRLHPAGGSHWFGCRSKPGGNPYLYRHTGMALCTGGPMPGSSGASRDPRSLSNTTCGCGQLRWGECADGLRGRGPGGDLVHAGRCGRCGGDWRCANRPSGCRNRRGRQCRDRAMQ